MYVDRGMQTFNDAYKTKDTQTLPILFKVYFGFINYIIINVITPILCLINFNFLLYSLFMFNYLLGKNEISNKEYQIYFCVGAILPSYRMGNL